MSGKAPTLKLNNGVNMPQLGLGTWQAADGEQVVAAVKAAIDCGYRLIDTATIYNNESGIGRAIKEAGVKRTELFVTTKLWNDSHSFDDAIRAFDTSLDKLGLDYLDLYLIHWPAPAQGNFKEAWRALEQLYADGRVRAIGVSNFKPHHLEELLAGARVVPAVNQIELHPLQQQAETRGFCAAHGIAIESYSPLMRATELLENSQLQAIADKHGRSVAQIILRWHVQSGFITIPKSVHTERIAQNIDVFDFALDDDDMVDIARLDQSKRVLPDPDKS